MRTEVAAIVAPIVSEAEQARREISKLHTALCDAERVSDSASQQRLKKLLALGERLILERSRHPSKGPKSKSWGELLADCGIEQQRASDAMRYAGYVEKVSPESGDTSELPSLRDAGVDKKPRKQAASDSSEDESSSPRERGWNPERFLLKLHDQLIKSAEACPVIHRQAMAIQLRNIAKLIEGMQ